MLTGEYNGISREDIREKLASLGVIAKIRERARRFADAAIKNLDVLAETEYRTVLGDIPGFVIDRET